MCKSHKDASQRGPFPHPHPHSARRCSLHSGRRSQALEQSTFLAWGSVLFLFPQVASLTVPLPAMDVSGLTGLHVADNTGGFPTWSPPTCSREPGTLGRTAQEASQFNTLIAEPPGHPWDGWGPWMGKAALVSNRASTGQLGPWSPGTCVLATTGPDGTGLCAHTPCP